nr:ATP-binding protein [Maribellus maritimus]
MTETNKILVIKSDKDELFKVERFIEQVFEEYELNKALYNRVLLCVSEAVINSIEHGNKNDSRKPVTIRIDCDFNHISVKVKDEGQGFNLDEVKNPILTKNLKKESGRGIHIIRSLSDSLRYNSKGNSVHLKMKCR